MAPNRKSGSESMMELNNNAIISGLGQQTISLEANTSFKSLIGPSDEELVGLNIEERKKKTWAWRKKIHGNRR